MRSSILRLMSPSMLLVACASAPRQSGERCPTPPMAATSGAASEDTGASIKPVTNAVLAAVPKSPDEAVARFFTAANLETTWFSDAFSAQVPLEKLESIRKGMLQRLGAFSKVAKVASAYETIFVKGKVPTKALLDDQGRFTTLWFGPAELAAITLDEAAKGLMGVPGTKGLLVITDGKERAATDADKPLAVGSAFKLAVLSALRTQIATKKRAWKDVVALNPKWKSLPSGMLQDWPDGTQLTLQTLASLMIARSDNTATDALISEVGRAAIEPLSPHARPFLTTRELFVLKAKGNEALRAAWSNGDETAHRAMLAELDAQPLPKVDAMLEMPTANEDIEWHFSARELCTLMEKVQDIPLMSINPGVAKSSDRDRVAYKGGSEPGVLNLTTWLTAKGHAHCVAFTVNHDKVVDEDTVFGLYDQVLAALH